MNPIKFALALTIFSLFHFNSSAQNVITNGLVAFYPFTGNANDVVGANNGTLYGGVTLASDRFGSNNAAYTFNGVDGYIDIGNPLGNSPANFTAAAWVKIISRETTGVVVEDVIITKRQTSLIGSGWPDLAIVTSGPNAGAGEIIIDADSYYVKGVGTSKPATNVWFFLCTTRSNNTYRIYLNGTLEQTITDSLSFSSSENMYLMHHGAWGTYCNGLLDDVRLYNRALTSNEVAQIYASENAVPVITAQPTNVTVNLGDTASFSVTATGVAPLTCQWFKDGAIIAGATNATLTLASVGPLRIGNYSILVTSASGSVVASAAASLSIFNINSALWQGLVAYYPFDGSAADAAGANHGTLYGGVTLASDRFGSNNAAYTFNGVDGYIDIGNPIGNSPTNFAETAWVKIISRETTGQVLEDVIITKRQTSNVGSGWPALAVIPNGANAGAGEIIIDADGYYAKAVGTSKPATNVWFFLCAVRSNNTYRLYLNGMLEQTLTDSWPVSSGENMYLMHHGAWGTYCKGLLDDLRFYNRALTADEVAQIYASETPPHSAAGVATVVNGFLVGVSLTDRGGGYTNAPVVRIVGGGGSGAVAVAVISNGVVTAINITNPGSGYTSTPLIFVDPPFISNPVVGIACASFLTFSNLTVGANYQLQHLTSYYWVNQLTSFSATNTLYFQIVSGTAVSGDYRLTPAPVPVQAFATPQVVNGFVVGANITSGGSGYINPPLVRIIGNPGSNAAATASVSNGAVTNIAIINPGFGYTVSVAIEIDPPPIVGLSPTVLPMVRLDSSNLAPYNNYQIQLQSAISASWGNLNTGPFSPMTVTNSQYLFATNGAGFFRLKYLP